MGLHCFAFGLKHTSGPSFPVGGQLAGSLLRSKVPKRVSDVALTHDGAYLLAADKFGDVQVAPTQPAGSCMVKVIPQGRACWSSGWPLCSSYGKLCLQTQRSEQGSLSWPQNCAKPLAEVPPPPVSEWAGGSLL